MTKKQLLMTILLVMAISMTGYSNYAYGALSTSTSFGTITVNSNDSLDLICNDPTFDAGESIEGREIVIDNDGGFGSPEFTIGGETDTITLTCDGSTVNAIDFSSASYTDLADINIRLIVYDDAEIDSQVDSTFEVADNISPTITGTGSTQTIQLEAVNSFSLPTPVVSDNDPAYSEIVTVGGDVPDTSVVGIYTITFSAPNDASGNLATGGADVVITVEDTTIPVLTPDQPLVVYHYDRNAVIPDTFTATVSDNNPVDDGVIVNCVEPLDTSVVGNTIITCDYTDFYGNSAIQVEYDVTIDPVTATAPTGLTSSLTVSSENSSVDLTWIAPSDDGGSPITNYVIEFGTTTGVYDTAVDTTVTGTSFTVSPLSENTEYFFIVRAENDVGINGASNESSITTFGVPELVLSFDGATTDSIIVDWVIDSNGGTITGLDLERSLDGISFADVEETETLGIDFIVDGSLTADTDFYYRMTATNEFGTSAVTLSIPASIMTTNLPVIDAVSDVSIKFGASYVDTIPECNDTEDGVIVATSVGTIDSRTPGIQTITYDCQDSEGNDAISVVRSVTVANKSGGGGSDEKHKTSPTSGKDWKTHRQIVEGGFKMNNVSFDLDDNWHTDFAKQNVKVGSLNSFVAKTFAQNGGLWIQEFAFGIPEIGEYNDAEALVEVHYNYDKTIKETKIIQNSGVINESSLFATTSQVSCNDDNSMMCYSTELKFIFDEPLKDDVMAIKAIDLSRRSMHPTYLNEGINVFGDSLTPSNTVQIVGTEKYEGLITVTQSEKYSDLWIAKDGRIFEMFGESDSFKFVNQEIDGTMNDRVSNELKSLTQKNALSVFDSASIQGSDKGYKTVEYPDIDTRTQFLLDHDLTGLTRGY